MDYEQKYKEALKKIREGLQSLPDGTKISGVTRAFLEEVFPELQESEDERIRKELIRETKGSEERLFEVVTNEEFIDWLEKQESRTSIDAAADNKSAIDDALWCVKQAYQTAKNENDTGTCWFAEKWLNDLRKRLR